MTDLTPLLVLDTTVKVWVLPAQNGGEGDEDGHEPNKENHREDPRFIPRSNVLNVRYSPEPTTQTHFFTPFALTFRHFDLRGEGGMRNEALKGRWMDAIRSYLKVVHLIICGQSESESDSPVDGDGDEVEDGGRT